MPWPDHKSKSYVVDYLHVATQTAAEPISALATIVLLGIGLAGLAGAEARRRRKKRDVSKS